MSWISQSCLMPRYLADKEIMLLSQRWDEGSYTCPLVKRHCVIELAQVSLRLLTSFVSKCFALPFNFPSGNLLKRYRMTAMHIELPLCFSTGVGKCPRVTHLAELHH